MRTGFWQTLLNDRNVSAFLLGRARMNCWGYTGMFVWSVIVLLVAEESNIVWFLTEIASLWRNIGMDIRVFTETSTLCIIHNSGVSKKKGHAPEIAASQKSVTRARKLLSKTNFSDAILCCLSILNIHVFLIFERISHICLIWTHCPSILSDSLFSQPENKAVITFYNDFLETVLLSSSSARGFLGTCVWRRRPPRVRLLLLLLQPNIVIRPNCCLLIQTDDKMPYGVLPHLDLSSFRWVQLMKRNESFLWEENTFPNKEFIRIQLVKILWWISLFIFYFLLPTIRTELEESLAKVLMGLFPTPATFTILDYYYLSFKL